MEFKNVDSLNISDCCELLRLNREELPDAIQTLTGLNELEELVAEKLTNLLKEDKSAFVSCNNVNHFEAYLSSWPDGMYAKQAAEILAKHKAKEEEANIYEECKKNLRKCDEYINKYPQGKFLREVKLIVLKSTIKRILITIFAVMLIFASVVLVFRCSQRVNSSTSSSGYVNYPKDQEASVNVSSTSVSYLRVSDDNLSFSQSGGTQSITVYTDGEWDISTDTYDWGHLTRSGNTLTLRVDANSGSDRTDYFIIKSGPYEKQVDIFQSGVAYSEVRVSNDDLSFSQSGGTQSITVYTDGEWDISTDTYDWGHLTRSGNTLTLRVDANSGSDRTDYFIIKSGPYEKQVDIFQSGASATYMYLDKSSFSVEKSGTPAGRCYQVNIDTDGNDVTASTSASWIDLTVVGNYLLEIETDYNSGSRRTATITVRSGNKSRQITVSQGGTMTCLTCFNGSYSTGQIWSVIGYDWYGYPQYGWIMCPACGGTGSIDN